MIPAYNHARKSFALWQTFLFSCSKKIEMLYSKKDFFVYSNEENIQMLLKFKLCVIIFFTFDQKSLPFYFQ